MENKFTEQDKQQVVEFLNFIATRATFPNWTTNDTIKHFKLLSYMQQTLLPKIDANILEVVSVRKLDETKQEESPKRDEKPARSRRDS